MEAVHEGQESGLGFELVVVVEGGGAGGVGWGEALLVEVCRHAVDGLL